MDDMGSRVFPMGDFGGGGRGGGGGRSGMIKFHVGEWTHLPPAKHMLIPLSSKKAPPTKD